MPSVPMVTPSLMARVLNSIGAAGRADARLDFGRETAQIEVAGHPIPRSLTARWPSPRANHNPRSDNLVPQCYEER
jgi:hypothetical protein